MAAVVGACSGIDLRVAVQRRITPHRDLGGEVHVAQCGRGAGAVGADALRVDEKVLADLAGEEVGHGLRAQVDLRRGVVIADGVQAVVDLPDAKARLQPALAGIPGAHVGTAEERRRVGEWPAGGAHDQALGALADEIDERRIAAHAGQQRALPAQAVVGAEGQVGIDLQLPGQLLDRAHQLLELGVRHRGGLHHVDRRLPAGDAVGAEEQALAPQQGVPAGAEGRFRFTQVEPAEDEGIEQLGLAPVALLDDGVELVVRHRDVVGGRGRIVVVGAVVDRVVPGRAAQARAEPLVEDVELAQQVDAVGDQPSLEVAIAVVQVRPAGKRLGRQR